MKKFITDFGTTMVTLNQIVDGHVGKKNIYKPGIGPYGENHIVSKVMAELHDQYPKSYIRPTIKKRRELGLEQYVGMNGGLATPDLILLENKIIEFKIARPINDNGNREDTWFKKCFEPVNESFSTFIDVEKLCRFSEEVDKHQRFEKWIIVIGFERMNEQEYKLDHVFPGLFQYISQEIKCKEIKEFVTETFNLGERHPYHQVLKLYAFKY
jgi:hypothetical protein